MKIAVVDWTDASYEEGEKTPDEVSPLIDLRSVGWLVREDKRSITLAVELAESEGTFRHIVHIPKVNIRRIKRLRS